MPLTKAETSRLFAKLDALTSTTIRVEERVTHIKEDVGELREDVGELREALGDHEKLGASQFLGTLNSIGLLKGKLALLEEKLNKPRGNKVNFTQHWKGLIAALTALVSAVGGIWALLARGPH